MSTNSYRTAATNNFNALKKLYEGNDDPPCAGAAFWKLGTSFDTMIDYFDVIDSTGASSFSKTVFAQFNASAKCLGGLDNAWFDDFGWWTVAAQRALQKSFFDPVIFQTIHDQCWKRFRDNARMFGSAVNPGRSTTMVRPCSTAFGTLTGMAHRPNIPALKTEIPQVGPWSVFRTLSLTHCF